jgi:aryl-alcohol dehydrogenase-like predicted oxidoreductase
MQYRILGRTGVRVSPFGLGTMVLGAWGNTDRSECVRIVHRAIDSGINLVDTADVYAFGESEEIVGEALRGRRDDVVVATKFHNGMSDEPNHRGNSRRWITRAVDDSLRRLGTDHIDVYQIHRPEPVTAIEETIDALTDLVRAGKILYWGTSTFPADELVETCWAADRRGVAAPHTEQPRYSIFTRGIERDVLPACLRHGLGVLTWSPLSGGWLTGKYRRDQPMPAGSRGDTNPDHFDGDNPVKFDAVERLAGIAADAGLSMTHLALAWAAEHPAVSSVLIGPRTEAQLDDLLGAAEVRLATDVLDAIDEVVPPGTDLNVDDIGWTPPGLDPARRRRDRPIPTVSTAGAPTTGTESA